MVFNQKKYSFFDCSVNCFQKVGGNPWWKTLEDPSETLPDYSIFWRDREDCIGGGVLLAVKADIRASRRSDWEKKDVELVVLKLYNGLGKPVLLHCFYHPDTAPEPLIKLNSSILETSESSCSIVIGDFNLPALDWSEDCCAPVNTGSRTGHNVFCDQLMDDNFFQQFIPGPTRIAGNKLDLLLCNCPEIIEDVLTSHPREKRFRSDHYVVKIKMRHKFKHTRGAKRIVFDYKNGNFDDLRDSLAKVPCWFNRHWRTLDKLERFIFWLVVWRSYPA